MKLALTKLIICFGVLFIMASVAQAQTSFERGSSIIFEDDLRNEKIGEFPSQWQLLKGSAEVARSDGGNVLSFLVTRTEVAPKMQENSYLPQGFTIEFDYMMGNETQHSYEIVFLNEAGRRSGAVRISGRRFQLSSQGKTLSEGAITSSSKLGWKRLALSFNQHELRVFSDGVRILNVPNFEAELRSFYIIGGRPRNAEAFIRNIVVAEGGMPLYERVISEGSFSTTEIQFDVNKAVIKPESAGIINQVYQLLHEHPDLRFSVEGHTDSDGNTELNQRLSLQRAQSVVQALIEKGIRPDRLEAKGWGDTKPVADNSTEAGKAQNRRVEFIRL